MNKLLHFPYATEVPKGFSMKPSHSSKTDIVQYLPVVNPKLPVVIYKFRKSLFCKLVPHSDRHKSFVYIWNHFAANLVIYFSRCYELLSFRTDWPVNKISWQRYPNRDIKQSLLMPNSNIHFRTEKFPRTQMKVTKTHCYHLLVFVLMLIVSRNLAGESISNSINKSYKPPCD